ncbi:MAG TPA: host-nuclease inhibitor Gam family protein [Candidatus Paceibacterota bacterium]
MSTSSTRIKRTSVPTPRNLEEADAAVGSIGNHQSLIDRLEANAEARIKEIREELRRTTEGVRKDRNAFMTGLFAFAEANKAILTEDGRKTVTLTNGTISWRWTPPAVSIEDDKEFLKLLHRRGLDHYIRTKEEVDREALLSERPRITGLSFTQKEEFVVKPAGATEVAKTRTISLD